MTPTAPDPSRLRRFTVAGALALLAACLWSLTHRHLGLWGDAELYAIQALARLHPWLATDLFLKYQSQDRFTLFSPLYAGLIDGLGLARAQALLFLVSTLTFLAAAWSCVRRLGTATTAWLALILLILTSGAYGPAGVLKYTQGILTARSVAEALVVAALAAALGGRRVLALGLTGGAFLMHPLMALPGLLLLGCLSVPPLVAAAGAVAATAGAALLSVYAHAVVHDAGPLALVTGDWLEILRERSQFLFLDLWVKDDWITNLLPFGWLALTATVVPDPRVRRLALGAMLVGAVGLAVAAIASAPAPVAILLQGQAWRWMWVTSFVAMLLLAPTLAALAADTRVGALAVALALGGTVCAALDPAVCIALTLLLWLGRGLITPRLGTVLRVAAGAVALTIAVHAAVTLVGIFTGPPLHFGEDPPAIAALRNVVGEREVAFAIAVAGWWLVTRPAPRWIAPVMALALAGALAMTLPAALHQPSFPGTEPGSGQGAFAEWRNAIPPTGTVATLDEAHSVTGPTKFVWFVLDRPNYQSIDQSAGVVFSRETALEVKRRAQVLAPLMPPSWMRKTFLDSLHRPGGAADKADLPDLPQVRLTAPILASICADAALDFVVARDDVGFEPIPHRDPGLFQNWYLYDCRKVRAPR